MPYLLGQYAFAAAPRHPFLRLLVDNVLSERIPRSCFPQERNQRVYYSTGPVMVTQSWVDYFATRAARRGRGGEAQADRAGEDGVVLLERKGGFGAFASHMNLGGWKHGRGS